MKKSKDAKRTWTKCEKYLNGNNGKKPSFGYLAPQKTIAIWAKVEPDSTFLRRWGPALCLVEQAQVESIFQKAKLPNTNFPLYYQSEFSCPSLSPHFFSKNDKRKGVEEIPPLFSCHILERERERESVCFTEALTSHSHQSHSLLVSADAWSHLLFCKRHKS